MLNEKRIKALIIVSLLLIESFVWIVNGPNNFWSWGYFSSDSGQTSNDGRQPLSDDQLPNGSEEGEADKNIYGKKGQGEQPSDNDGKGEPEGYPPLNTKNRDLELLEAKEKGLLILVNKEHPIDKDYKPGDLAKMKDFVSDRSETTRYMRAEAAEAFGKFVDKAASEGIDIKMTTAYRSYDFQKILFENYVKNEGEEQASKFSAKPGQSEHQTGLAVDVSSPSVDYQLSNDYGKTKEGKWVADNAYRFGFILRFPQGKEEITGYQYEPWHLRYVGLTAAKEIHEQGITLEEFLQGSSFE